MRVVCRVGLLFVALVAAPVVGAPPGSDAPGLDRLWWLEGEWARATAGGTMVESWQRVSQTTMEGTSTRHVDGASRVTEYLRLEQMGEGIFYTAKPLENRLPTPFELVEWSEERFVFENRQHDFPQRIIYTRRGDNGLVARIEGSVDGEERAIDFVFDRAR